MRSFYLVVVLVVMFNGCNIETGSSSTILSSTANTSLTTDDGSSLDLDKESSIGNGSSLNDEVQGDSVPAIPLEDLGLGDFQ